MAPHYEHGYNGRQSKIREGIVLDLVSMEMECANLRQDMLALSSVCGAHYDTSKISDVVATYKDKFDIAAAYASYDIDSLKPKKSKLQSATEKLVAKFKAMQVSGELDRIREKHRKIAENLR